MEKIIDGKAMRDEILRLEVDRVFNLVESLGDSDSLLYIPLALLDVLGVPYDRDGINPDVHPEIAEAFKAEAKPVTGVEL